MITIRFGAVADGRAALAAGNGGGRCGRISGLVASLGARADGDGIGAVGGSIGCIGFRFPINRSSYFWIDFEILV